MIREKYIYKMRAFNINSRFMVIEYFPLKILNMKNLKIGLIRTCISWNIYKRICAWRFKSNVAKHWHNNQQCF